MIYRSRRTVSAAVPTSLLEDPTLSFKAKGIACFLLTKPPGWRIDARGLATLVPDGRDAILSGLKELEQAGYLLRRKVRVGAQWHTESVLHESPAAAAEIGFAELDEPESGNGLSDSGSASGVGFPGSGFPGSVKPGLIPSSDRKTLFERTPSGEGEEAKTDSSSPTADPDPVGAEARDVARRHWDDVKARTGTVPLIAGDRHGKGFVALANLCRKALEAGHPPEAVLDALGRTRTYTLSGIQFALREPTVPAARRNGRRDRMSGLIEYAEKENLLDGSS